MNTSLLVVILGETASGKSALAVELAERVGGEIICADSWTVYKDFTIGTAKPSAAEQAAVRHHLLDIADPRDGFSAVLFQRLAQTAITDIHDRGKVPIMVGGTGLYIDSVIFNYGFLPAPDPALRAELSALSLPDVLERAHSLQLDLSQVDTRNKRRVIRLIENNGQLPSRQELRDHTVLYGIRLSRDALRTRIEDRVDAMLTAGLEAEVAELAKRYGWSVEPMRGIGYREWQDYFSGHQNLAETRQRIIKSTMELAKRQRTWFRRNNSIHWIDNRGQIPTIVDTITTNLNK